MVGGVIWKVWEVMLVVFRSKVCFIMIVSKEIGISVILRDGI